LSSGEVFLPDPSSYEDLFYKIVETGDFLIKFRDAYGVSQNPGSSSIETLISVSSHYHAILEGSAQGKFRNKNLSPKEVSRVIKQGYDTLSIEAKEGLDRWDSFREANHKTVLKRIARIAGEDANALQGDLSPA
jgi:hypothetical protein